MIIRSRTAQGLWGAGVRAGVRPSSPPHLRHLAPQRGLQYYQHPISYHMNNELELRIIRDS